MRFYQATSWFKTSGELAHWKHWFDSLGRKNEIRARGGKWFALFVEVDKKPLLNTQAAVVSVADARIEFTQWQRYDIGGYDYCEATINCSLNSSLLRTWGMVFHGNSLTLPDRKDEERQRIEIDLIRRSKAQR